jgi:hypothetical protein
MPRYASRIVGNVTDRWTKKGQEREMEALSATLTANAQEGWRLHSLQPVPVFGGISQKQAGVILLAVYEQG